MSPTPAAISSRPFRDDEDFWRIRQLCLETYPITGPCWNWDTRRWDGSRFYEAVPHFPVEWQQTIRIWETGGRLAGAANLDGSKWFFLQMHPDFRAIEEEMIAWAEDALAARQVDSPQREINIEVYEYDQPRQRILARRGYEKLPEGGVFRHMCLGQQALPPVVLADGYTMREIDPDDLQDCQRLADLLNAAFRRTFHKAGEFYNFAREAPDIRPDLHLVAVAPDGSFAAHAAAIYEEVNRRGLYEPVCTHPDHRRKNLAQALMTELLYRLRDLGACEVTVETGDMIPANGLYDAFGFSEVYYSRVWRKVLTAPGGEMVDESAP